MAVAVATTPTFALDHGLLKLGGNADNDQWKAVDGTNDLTTRATVTVNGKTVEVDDALLAFAKNGTPLPAGVEKYLATDAGKKYAQKALKDLAEAALADMTDAENNEDDKKSLKRVMDLAAQLGVKNLYTDIASDINKGIIKKTGKNPDGAVTQPTLHESELTKERETLIASLQEACGGVDANGFAVYQFGDGKFTYNEAGVLRDKNGVVQDPFAKMQVDTNGTASGGEVNFLSRDGHINSQLTDKQLLDAAKAYLNTDVNGDHITNDEDKKLGEQMLAAALDKHLASSTTDAERSKWQKLELMMGASKMLDGKAGIDDKAVTFYEKDVKEGSKTIHRKDDVKSVDLNGTAKRGGVLDATKIAGYTNGGYIGGTSWVDDNGASDQVRISTLLTDNKLLPPAGALK